MNKTNQGSTPRKSEAMNKAQSISGYRGAADKARDKAILHTQGLCIGLLVLTAFSLCLSIVSLFMIKGLTPKLETVDNGWIDMETDNSIGYSARNNWAVSGVNGAVVYQIGDSTIASVQATALSLINENAEVKCTSDNLLEYFMKELSASSTDDMRVSDVQYKEYPVLDAHGYYVTFTQSQTVDGVTASSYTDTLLFIYDSYLYSFTYANSYRTTVNSDFEYMLKSIHVVTDRPDNGMTSFDIGQVSVDAGLISDYENLLPSNSELVSTATSVSAPVQTSSPTSSDDNTTSP